MDRKHYNQCIQLTTPEPPDQIILQNERQPAVLWQPI